MNSDEARELFSDALEGTLEEARRKAFEQALVQDPELRDEWETFRAVMKGVARLGDHEGETAAPNLLPHVQSKLRRRSRGRFYRDRFSEQAGLRSSLPLLVAILVALLLASAWVATQSMIVIESAAPERSSPGAPGQ